MVIHYRASANRAIVLPQREKWHKTLHYQSVIAVIRCAIVQTYKLNLYRRRRHLLRVSAVRIRQYADR